MTMITQYITSKQKLLRAVASRTLKVLSLLFIFTVSINSNNLFAQGVPANPNDPDQAPAPTITSQPASMTACAGSTASFSVSATAGSSISYQWKKNGTNIGGATSSTLTLTAVSSANAGSYSVVVTSSGVPVTSSTATLVVTTPALSYPESLSTCASTYTLDAGTGYSSVTWSASAGGSTLPSNPGDPDAAVLTPSQYLAASNGWYKVIAVPASGCTLIDSVYVTVNMGPTIITSQPSAQTLNSGGNASFSVSATGLGTLTYQWFKNGVAISGATNSTYSISGVTASNAGNYSVEVTGTCGSATSNAAQLTVNTLAISSQPVSASQCAGSDVTFSVSATSSGSISYQWKKNGSSIAGATNSSLTLNSITGSDAGSYSVELTAAAGTITSNTATLTVGAATSVNTQPSNQSVYGNGSASFTVSATGSGTLTYQWSKNGSPISGETSSTLTINNATSNDDADYSVSVTGNCGVVTSNNAHLTVTIVNPPSISLQPASVSQCAGTNASFSVTASVSAGSISYQWKKDGVAISGATNNSLSLNGINNTNAGSYTVDVIGVGGTTTSNAASLTVNPTASIVSQPVNQFRNAGNNTLFKVVPGPGVTAYVWKKNGTALSNGGKISGATSSELLVSNVSGTDAGNYTVDLTFGGCGSLTSASANLAVLTSQPLGTAKCAGQNASFSASVSTGSASVSYQWLKDGNNISGATSSSLSLSNVSASDIGNYTVNMTVAGSTITSTGAYLSVNALTAITAQPVSTTKFTTQGYLFSANGTGSGNVTYQWTKDGNNISGATSPSLSLSNISTSAAGSYALVVSGTCGTATSNSASLTVISATPSSQAVCTGSNASFSATVTGPSTVSYVWKKNGTTLSGQTSSTLSLSNVSAADNGNYALEISVDGNTTSVGSGSLLVNAATVITSQPVSVTKFSSQGYLFNANGTGSGNVTYQWTKDGSNISGATTTSLNISNISSASAGNYALVVTGACGSATSNNGALTVISALPVSQTVCTGSNASFSATVSSPSSVSYVWKKNSVNMSGQTSNTLSLSNVTSSDNGSYSLTITADGNTTTVGSASLLVNANTAITSQPISQTRPAGTGVTFTVAATGTGAISYQWKKDGTDILGETSYKLDLTNLSPSAAGNYSVSVSSTCGSVNSNNAALTVTVAAPVISVHPIALVKQCPGTSTSLSVTASGYGTLNYQWKKNNVDISGATNSSLSLNNLSSNDAATYTVVVSNLGGSVTSSSSAVSVKSATSISSQPTSLLRRAGQSASFFVNATGADGGSFQWKKDGSAISGATSSFLNLASVSSTNAGNYTVDVTFGCGTVSSSSASLAVMNNNPSNVTKCAGENASFSISVSTGSDAVSYQWLKNNVNMPGQTSSTLSLSNVSSNDVANYSVNVTLGSTSLLSNSATLLVNTLSISSQPVSLLRRAGQSASFVVSTSSAASYQWKKDGSAISGATSSSLDILNVSSLNAGNYTVDVTSGCGTVSSNSASLAVLNTNPVNLTKCAGENASFSVSVSTGSDAVSYQWLKNNVNMPGQTSSTLSLSNVSSNDVANYSVYISMGSSSLLSNSATLLVNTSATISSQPVSAVRFASQSVAFSTIVTGNINGLTYQWTKDGSPISNSTSVLGATTSTLYLSSTTTASAGNYVLNVTGNCGTISSNAAALGIVSTYTIADQSMCAGNNATFSVSATGSGLTYQWKKNGNDISGATSASLTLTGVSAADAANYSVAVGNSGNSVTTGYGILNVRLLPSITTQPTNVNVAVGGTANFSVAANNATSFRWFRFNKVLENPAAPVGGSVLGTNTNSFTMSNVGSSFNNYRYVARIVGACGTIYSDTVKLTVGGSSKNEFTSVAENIETSLFPVPAQNVITLLANGVEEGTYSILILDQTGKLIMNRNTSGAEVNAGLSIEISDISAGAYFMELKNANGEVVSMNKFIKVGN